MVGTFCKACEATESSTDDVLLSAICTVIDQAVLMALYIYGFQSPVEQDVYKFLLRPSIVDAVAMHIIDDNTLTVFGNISVNEDVKRYFLVQVKMEERYNRLTMSVDDQNAKEKNGFPPIRMGSSTFRSP